MRRAERSGARELRRGLGAVKKELVPQGVSYASVCDENDDRVPGGLEMAKWRKGKEVWDRRRRVVTHRELQKVCVW